MEKINNHHVSSSAAFWMIREEQTAWKYRNREGMSEAAMKGGKKRPTNRQKKKGRSERESNRGRG